MKKKFKRKRGPVRSKKVSFDGITFASGLERYMYQALKKAKSELAKFKHMAPSSAEASVVRTYLDCLVDVPWKKKSKIQ